MGIRGRILALSLTLAVPVCPCAQAGGLIAISLSQPPPQTSIPETSFPELKDVTGEVGLDFTNLTGDGTGEYIVGAIGNGAGFFDYDRDGDIDLVIANGSTLDDYVGGGTQMLVLYENSGTGMSRTGASANRFADVTGEAGLARKGWGMGVCVADIDNDGFSDLYLTAYGPNVLFHNVGDGTFEELADAGVAGDRWSTGCAFGDYDRDGWVDLYVSNYLTFDAASIPPRGCVYRGMRVLCGPLGLEGESDRLYRNNGDGTFTDVTETAGIADPGHYGLGVVFSDLDNDGWPDIYVANDSVPNLLFHNLGDGTFSEVGLRSGTSLSAVGRAQAGMGLAVSDYDGNGTFDIFVTNFANDTNTLYRNLGDMLFVDATAESAAAAASFPYVGWGTGFVDLDNDGWQDLYVANGNIYFGTVGGGSDWREIQPDEVYRNLGDGRFRMMVESVRNPGVRSARGVAFGDYDNDGDVDLVAINLNDRPSFYSNEGGTGNHWISLRLEGVASNRDAIGARIEIDAGGRTSVREIRSGGSFLSHSDLRVHFGLGGATRIERIRIRWPGGNTQELEDVGVNQFLTVREGVVDSLD